MNVKTTVTTTFKIQSSDYIRLLAIADWFNQCISDDPETWVSIASLYTHFSNWVVSSDTWKPESIETVNIFGKRLKQLSTAKGYAFSARRKKGVRGVQGLNLLK